MNLNIRIIVHFENNVLLEFYVVINNCLLVMASQTH